MRLRDLPDRLEAILEGLVSTEAKKRLHLHGPSSLVIVFRLGAKH